MHHSGKRQNGALLVRAAELNFDVVPGGASQMKLVILHLSDIHISKDTDPVLKMGTQIARASFTSLVNADRLLIVISGDIANSGKREEYSLATAFLRTVESEIKNEFHALELEFIIVPGNHDCDLSGDQRDRNDIIDKILPSRTGQEQQNMDGGIFDICIRVQNEFEEFRAGMCHHPAHIDRLWITKKYDINGVSVIVDGINLSWASQNPEGVGKIYFPIRNYESKLTDECAIRIAVFHHPAHWLSQSIYREFRTFVRRLANIVLTGHEHKSNNGTIEESESGSSNFVEAGALQYHGVNGLRNTGFSIITICGDGGEAFTHEQFAYDEINEWYAPRARCSRTIAPVRRSSFQIVPEFLDTLEDVITPGSQPARREVRLSDVFEFPMLRALKDRDGDDIEFVSSSVLTDASYSSDPVILLGPENAGKTSILYQLFKRFWEAGFIPVYLDASRVKRTDPVELGRVIATAVEEQFGKTACLEFQQTPKERKRLLLDNIDNSQIKNSKTRAQALEALLSMFGGAVITAPPEYGLKEVLSKGPKDELNLRLFQMEPFGHVLRAKLVEKWMSAHVDEGAADELVLKKRDEAERLLSDVTGNNMIPSLPLFLITLLQSLDVGKQDDLRGAGLGHYYEYLLTEHFLAAGAKREKLVELYSYLGALAWHLHQSEAREISLDAFRLFNEKYSTDWVRTDFKERLDFLLRSKVIRLNGEDIYFKYEFIYFLMKAKHMSDRLQDVEVQEHLKACCAAIHMRDNAQTILFLSHYSIDGLLLDQVMNASRGAFADKSATKFDEDINPIKQLIVESPKLVLPGSSPEENRQRRNETRDHLNRSARHGTTVNSEDEVSRSDVGLSLLFKSSEIIGQLLKDQYSRIDRQRKRELIKEVFDAPMRGVAFVYKFLADLPPVLRAALDDVGAATKENELKRERLARQVVSLLVQVITLVFINRAADSARSDEITDDIAAVVREGDNNAYYLIDMAIELDRQRPLPKSKLKDLQKRFDGNIIAEHLLRWLVINRLMMFVSTPADFEWAVNQFNLSRAAVRTLSTQSLGPAGGGSLA